MLAADLEPALVQPVNPALFASYSELGLELFERRYSLKEVVSKLPASRRTRSHHVSEFGVSTSKDERVNEGFGLISRVESR